MKKSLALAFLLALASSAFAADPPLPAGVTQGPTVEGITEYTLANGLRVLFAPDDSKPTTTVNTTYMVGSRMEHYGETGMAHLLEHLMFKGTPKYPLVWGEFSKRGLKANGSTWTDRTNYFASWAANDASMDWYLHWSADAMTHSFIARKDLDSEMTVVRNELELDENDPFRSLVDAVMATAYTWHSYGKSTIGARADVENVNIEHLQAFYRKYYQPDNAVLIVTGKFDPAKTMKTIAETFGKIPRPKRVLDPLYTIDRAQQGERSVTLRRVGDTQILAAGYHVPGAGDPEFAAVQLLETILGDTPTGRLHKALVEKHLAAQVFAFDFQFKDPTLVLFFARLPNDAKLEPAREALLSTIEGIAAQPITEAELDRARTQWLKQFDLTASNPEEVGVALSEAIGDGDWRLFFLQRDRVRSATLADVQRVASSYFLADNRTLGTFLPTAKPVRAPDPKFVDVAPMVKDYKGDPPVAKGEAFDATPKNIESRIERTKLANGMQLALLPKRTRGGTVNARLNLHLGDEKSLSGLFAVGSATGAMLSRGAGGLTREQIQDRFDKLKAQVSIGGGPASASVTIETVRENLPEVLKLVATVLRKPDFPASELEQLKNEQVTNFESQRKEPGSVAQIALQRHDNPYPKGDVRYIRDFDESIAEARAVKLEDLRAFHDRFYGADSGDLAVVGDFDAAAVKKAAAELFGDWKARQPYSRVPTPVYPLSAVSKEIETPDKANAFLFSRLMFPLQDSDPDYPAALTANFATGGGPGARLWARIREKEGLSYGVGSSLNVNPFEKTSIWTVYAIFAPENLAKVRKGYDEELAAIVKDGFTAAQLEDARKGLLQTRQLSRAQDGSLAQKLAADLELGRTMDFDAKVDAAIAALTLDQVNAAFRKYIDPSKAAVFAAGDFAKGKK